MISYHSIDHRRVSIVLWNWPVHPSLRAFVSIRCLSALCLRMNRLLWDLPTIWIHLDLDPSGRMLLWILAPASVRTWWRHCSFHVELVSCLFSNQRRQKAIEGTAEQRKPYVSHWVQVIVLYVDDEMEFFTNWWLSDARRGMRDGAERQKRKKPCLYLTTEKITRLERRYCWFLLRCWGWYSESKREKGDWQTDFPFPIMSISCREIVFSFLSLALVDIPATSALTQVTNDNRPKKHRDEILNERASENSSPQKRIGVDREQSRTVANETLHRYLFFFPFSLKTNNNGR